ncbi:hypothetical protein Q4530_16940 [Colwellia sp. 1_MG-2023]|uniref:hypothetical protein n=1 Tax=Colwellia sp. 1_MG-2023 TaxID=3062649 RepID=UPI0026E442C8|nr:hypothetical protein [Colwellia sp. 1_MG-2023]MDO6667122.1 hypothetical protein [Colwellia sp. 2_MG-2023]MDO6691461.1 hypothetical protein [Colwellia sp. 1_MG-2023]
MLLLESTVHRSTFVVVLKCGSQTGLEKPTATHAIIREYSSSLYICRCFKMWLPKLGLRNQQRHMVLLESTVHRSTFVVVLKCGSPNWA